mmetsp:Transcript_63425/g.148964  ORF Transcript_63425/g.148964 Transcript_63425/m.148964 type:complete len:833 (+) Transcript_63425:61-2559(+)
MTSQALEATAIRHLAVTQSQLHTVCEEEFQFEGATTVAQIFQGVAFMALAIMLIFMNNAKIGAGSKAPLEVRYATAITISIAVCLFSGFFNILQLTAIDDISIPGYTGGFVLQIGRPIEWVLTCPLLQLKLVVLAGARVPSYRRFMMPLLSAAVLLCGVAATFTEGALRYVWFGFGTLFMLIMFWHNIIQIGENSEGEESFLHGDSDYRKLTLILIITWFPFPIWYFLSPEGFDLVDDPLTIEMGWVVLNMLAKMTYIILAQRMKMVHQRKVEAARELYGLSPSDAVPVDALNEKAVTEAGGKVTRGMRSAQDYGLGLGEEAESEEKLVELVHDTMVTLQLPNHTDRLLKLLVESGVTNTSVLEKLNQERCMELCLPWALVDAVQRRWSNEKMDMGQDQGGVVDKADPFTKVLEANKERLSTMQSKHASGVMTPPVGGTVDLASLDEQIAAAVQRAVMPLHETVMSKLQTLENNVNASLDSTQESVAQRMDFGQVTLMQTVNACQVLLHKVDSSQEVLLQKIDVQKKELESISAACMGLQGIVAGAQDTTKQALVETVSTSSSVLLQKLDATQQDLLRQSNESHSILQGVASAQTSMASKMEAANDKVDRRMMEVESNLDKKMTELGETVTSSYTVSSESVLSTLKDELAILSDQTKAVVTASERSTAIIDERMGEVRRQNLMVMDLLTNANEGVPSDQARGLDGVAIMELRSVLSEELSRAGVDDGSFRGAVVAMMERLEESAARLEIQNGTNNIDTVKQELTMIEDRMAKHQAHVVGEVREVKEGQLGLQAQVADFATRIESNMEKLTTPPQATSSPSRRTSNRGKEERG